MAKKIFKYTLEITPHQTLELPKGSTILSVANQYERLVLYVSVDTEETNNTSEVDVYILNTGDSLNAHTNEFIGTVLFHDGEYVAHVYLDARQYYMSSEHHCTRQIPY